MSEALWTAAELAAATGGRASDDFLVAGVSIDSRTVLPGDLFIALRGPRHDGHDFVAAALERGAAALVERVPEGVARDASLLVVDDTLRALTALGRAARARSRARIAAITGSVGKTGTKEALRLGLAGQAPTHASAASHNNHWGVPLSLARAPKDTIYAVYELGMNAPGEIAALARLVRPHVAMITTIEPAHLGFFPSVAAIAEAKGEILQGLEPEGDAVLYVDNPHFSRLKQIAEAAGCARVIGFGEGATANARLIDAHLDAAGSDVVMVLDRHRLAFRIGAPGRHWVINSLGVLACASALGADLERAAAALVDFAPPEGRGQRHRLPWPGGEVTLIDESYNANPASMRAALALLAAAPGRRLAALGRHARTRRSGGRAARGAGRADRRLSRRSRVHGRLRHAPPARRPAALPPRISFGERQGAAATAARRAAPGRHPPGQGLARHRDGSDRRGAARATRSG